MATPTTNTTPFQKALNFTLENYDTIGIIAIDAITAVTSPVIFVLGNLAGLALQYHVSSFKELDPIQELGVDASDEPKTTTADVIRHVAPFAFTTLLMPEAKPFTSFATGVFSGGLAYRKIANYVKKNWTIQT